MVKLKPGDHAPEIALSDGRGRPFRLSTLRGAKNAVVFFYPRDNGIVCTREACAFRDAFEEFVSLGTVVLGISPNDAASHRKFALQWQLPFTLLTDPGRGTHRAYGVGRRWILLRDRVTFVIDREGIIRSVNRNLTDAQVHVRGALDLLERQRKV